jgi:uncharacterized protein (DUF433 family)
MAASCWALLMGTKKRVKALDIVRDIRSGMTESELKEKYKLSSQALRTAARKLERLRQWIAEEMVADIRSGMTELELLAKYDISDEGLQVALRKLVKQKLIEPSEVYERRSLDDSQIRAEDLRSQVRHHVALPIWVCEGNRPENTGMLHDITVEGVGIRGIETMPDEVKSLAILGDELGSVEPFEFDAQCRWVADPGQGDLIAAGFQIVKISEADLRRLREFMQLVLEADEGRISIVEGLANPSGPRAG